jgi:excisionase family DNA binding protein
MTTKTDTLTPDLLNVVAAARYLGVHAEYVRQLIRTGKISARRFGRSYVLAMNELEQFQRERMR